MPFSMRAARADDAAFVLELFLLPNVAAFTHGPRSADEVVRAIERERSDSMIVERDGVPFGHLILDNSAEWLAELRVIAVRESGSGAGRFAMEWVLARAFDELRAHRTYLEVVSSNERARRLYAQCGFREEGRFRDGYRAGVGMYADLSAYGILASDYHSRVPPLSS